MAWLARHPDFDAANDFTVSSSLAAFGMGRPDLKPSAGDSGGAAAPRLLILPAPGLHALRFRGRRVWISRERQPGASQLCLHPIYVFVRKAWRDTRVAHSRRPVSPSQPAVSLLLTLPSGQAGATQRQQCM